MVFLQHLGQGQPGRDVDRAIHGAVAHIRLGVALVAHIGVDVPQALRVDIHQAQGQWRTNPLVQVETGKGHAQCRQVQFDLPQGMGTIENHVHPMLFCRRNNRFHRHDQAGAMGNVSEGHQLDPRVALKRLAIAGHQAFKRGGVGVGNFDNFKAALACNPTHGVLDAVVFQIADQQLVARLQAVVVADQ